MFPSSGSSTHAPQPVAVGQGVVLAADAFPGRYSHRLVTRRCLLKLTLVAQSIQSEPAQEIPKSHGLRLGPSCN